MIKSFLRNLLTEPASKLSAAGNQPPTTAAVKVRPANPIRDFKGKAGASKRVNEGVPALHIEEGIRAADEEDARNRASDGES